MAMTATRPAIANPMEMEPVPLRMMAGSRTQVTPRIAMASPTQVRRGSRSPSRTTLATATIEPIRYGANIRG